MDLSKPDDAERYARDMAQDACSLFYKDGYVNPVGFVLASRLPDGRSLPRVAPVLIRAPVPPCSHPECLEQDDFTKYLKRAAIDCRAVGVIMIAQGVHLLEFAESENMPTQAELRQNWEKHPDSKEAIMVFLEHQRIPSVQLWHSLITRDMYGHGRLSAVELVSTAMMPKGFDLLPKHLYS